MTDAEKAKLATIIGENLRRLRSCRGLTQSELAWAASISIGALHNYEAGKVIPKVNVLTRLSYALDVAVFDLVVETIIPQAVRFREPKP